MLHASFLETLKIEYDDFLSVDDEDDSKFPKINDKDKDRKIVR